MNRRGALLALATLGAFGPRLAAAQAPAKTVGVLSLSRNPNWSTWTQTLEKLGWAEGKGIRFEYAYADGKTDLLPELAAGLIRKNVDVILADGPDAAVDAARATKTIPVVFFGAAYPVEQGIVETLARPGGNVTGVAFHSAYVKQLEFVRQVAPRAKRVAHFRMPTATRTVNGKPFVGLFPLIESTAKGMGLEMKSFVVNKPEDFEQAFKDIKGWKAQALVTYATPPTILARQRIVEFANANHIPSFFDWRGFVESGGLFSYGPLISELRAQAARQLDRVLRGARPADLPVELPARYEFVINLKTASALGIKIPQELMLRADQVIE
jgi:putative ABC transport system substrate-binding protein